MESKFNKLNFMCDNFILNMNNLESTSVKSNLLNSSINIIYISYALIIWIKSKDD